MPFARAPRKVPELSYASPSQPRLKRWLIRSVEEMSGRRRYARLYEIWRHEVALGGRGVFGRMMELVEVRVRRHGAALPNLDEAGPLVLVANHPFGIGDGMAILALAESLGRPFRVLIHSELLKLPEIRPYALPVDFGETAEALRNNIAVRHEAVRLLKQGVTIVVFPAGGVATAPHGFGRAVDLPWKMFPARLVQEARASVLPVFFDGQNGRLFHLVSKPMPLAGSEKPFAKMIGNAALTLRLSLLLREFTKLRGKTIDMRVGELLPWNALAAIRERKALLEHLHRAVHELAPRTPLRGRRRRMVGPSRPGLSKAA